jgi:hypothetical protein
MEPKHEKAARTRKINLLARVERAQNIYSRWKKDERTDVWIFNKYVKADFSISLSTFRKWLGISVIKERKSLKL